jgi:hypothetical protein
LTPGALALARRCGSLALLAALLIVPPWAAWRVSGARVITLDLGPGDGPYVHGFTPEWEVDDGVGTHWTTYEAAAVLPLEIRGPLRLVLRYSRVLPQTAVVDVSVAGQPAPRFSCRGGLWDERSLEVGSVPPQPAVVAVHVDSHERRNLGLKLDWMRLEAGGTRLLGRARLRPIATVWLVALLLLALGWSLEKALAFTAAAAGALTALLLHDPWLTHRLLAHVPESLAAGLALVLPLRALARFRSGFPLAMKRAGTIAVGAFLLRAAAINHPAFYYPDLLAHARLVQVVRSAGFDYLRAPSHYLWGDPAAVTAEGRAPSGLWLKNVGGRAFGPPYSLAFHAPFAAFPATLDERIRGLKVWGAFVSVVPILAVGALARRYGLSLLGLGALLFVPTYLSRLTLGLLPALFGHAVEMLFLVWLAHRPAGRWPARTVATGVVLLAACQLAYISPSASLLVALLAADAFRSHEADARPRAFALLTMLLAASALSLLGHYRDFLTHGVPGVQGATAGAAFENPLARLGAVIGTAFVVAAAAGTFVLRRVVAARTLLAAWAMVGLTLLALRMVVPVLRFCHEELWIAPLVCLSAGEAVAWLWSRGGWRSAAAVAAALAIAIQGSLMQWRALTAQLR